MIRIGGAIVFEHVPFETLERHSPQEARRHDAIGVEIVAAQRQPAAGDARDACHAGISSSSVRTSTTSPARAAAATIAGLISSVRPVGLPWRPLKLRFEEEAHT
jgi:hypothetical protein